jgi:queuine/archaeosine tRNA-ribosyltransferase
MGHGGQVTPAEYMKCVDALKPDIFTLLSDELPAYSNPRKQQTAVERTRTVRTHLPKR